MVLTIRLIASLPATRGPVTTRCYLTLAPIEASNLARASNEAALKIIGPWKKPFVTRQFGHPVWEGCKLWKFVVFALGQLWKIANVDWVLRP